MPPKSKLLSALLIQPCPDIEDYMGHGDLQVVCHKGWNACSLLLRNNFNGYGESLID